MPGTFVRDFLFGVATGIVATVVALMLFHLMLTPKVRICGPIAVHKVGTSERNVFSFKLVNESWRRTVIDRIELHRLRDNDDTLEEGDTLSRKIELVRDSLIIIGGLGDDFDRYFVAHTRRCPRARPRCLAQDVFAQQAKYGDIQLRVRVFATDWWSQVQRFTEEHFEISEIEEGRHVGGQCGTLSTSFKRSVGPEG